jgi:hypothetical protein
MTCGMAVSRGFNGPTTPAAIADDQPPAACFLASFFLSMELLLVSTSPPLLLLFRPWFLARYFTFRVFAIWDGFLFSHNPIHVLKISSHLCIHPLIDDFEWKFTGICE